MNLFDKLTEKEAGILVPLLTGFTLSEVAIINQCTIKKVYEYRVRIIRKLEKV